MAWAPDYATALALREYVRIDDAADDDVLTRAIATASRAIDQATGRQFGLVDAPELRYYPAQWNPRLGRWVLDVDDLMTTVGLVVEQDGTAVAAADYELSPRNAPVAGRPYTQVRLRYAVRDLEVEVTARWGWTTVPPAVEQACLLQASRLVKRRDSPFGVAGSPEAGSEMRLLARVDPDVEVALRAYRRMWGAA